MAVDQFQLAHDLAKEIGAAVLHGKRGDGEKYGHRPHVLDGIARDNAHINGLDLVSARTRRQRGLAQRADRHLQEVGQHVVPFAVMGKAFKRLDELFSEVGRVRHA